MFFVLVVAGSGRLRLCLIPVLLVLWLCGFVVVAFTVSALILRAIRLLFALVVKLICLSALFDLRFLDFHDDDFLTVRLNVHEAEAPRHEGRG